MSRLIAFVCLSFCLLSVSALSASALAATPEDLGLGYLTAVKESAQPMLVLKPTAAITSVAFTLTDRSTGKVQVVRAGAIGKGATKRLPIAFDDGRTTFDGAIAVTWASGETGDYTVTFDAVRYHALKLDMTWEDVDLDHRVVHCRASHEVEKIAIVLEDERGDVITREERVLDPPVAGGEPLTIAWPEASRAPSRLKLQVYDPDGVWASMDITPFTIQVPHDEVQFELGHADIPKAEIPKLEKTLATMRAAMRQHGSLLDLKLFIAGYTDTVGDHTKNQALSLARAAAISRWFRGKGVRLPIFYRGFGEDELAVATPDDTDEVRNRRALYILSVYPPLGVRVVAATGWEELQP